VLWLACQLDPPEVSPVEVSASSAPVAADNLTDSIEDISPPLSQSVFAAPAVPQPSVSVNAPPAELPASQAHSHTQRRSPSEGIPFQSPAAPALRNTIELGRSLRPLMRKVPSRTEQVLDEEATAIQIAESAGQRQWMPVFTPAAERWLDLALVVEESRSTVLWRELIAEFQVLLERQGAFRHLQTWSLRGEGNGAIVLLPRSIQRLEQQRPRSPRELLDPSGRQLILFLSDCTSLLWRQGTLYPILKQWADANPVAIIQLLPERMWARTALGFGLPAQLRALRPGMANSQLQMTQLPVWETVPLSTSLTLPIVALEPQSLGQWARVMGGIGGTQTAGVVFDLAIEPRPASSSGRIDLAPEELVQRFQATASPMARRLAALMSIVPVSVPVVYLIQEAVLPSSHQVHVAEVFMSGLLEPQSQAEPLWYEFVSGVRERLQASVPKTEALMVLDKVSQYIAERAGLSIKSFAALLVQHSERGATVGQEVQRFAEITTDVLRRLGGDYAALAATLERDAQGSSEKIQTESSLLPGLKTLEFDAVYLVESLSLDSFFPEFQMEQFTVATLVVDEGLSQPVEVTEKALERFEFTVATLEKQGGLLGIGGQLKIQRRQQQAYRYVESLSNRVSLEMVAIPAGQFLMGSPRSEEGSSESERPQHRVSIQAFFMSRYPVTQAQWRAIASLPQVNRALKPDPSRFKGNNHPVERVSWYDAVEWCDRLSQLTNRQYRLPTEAEWEYACRAGSTAPFHFGKTITVEVANYDAREVYGGGVKGEYREETTPVDHFRVANAFGLCEMHGNVWEWCLDHWHESYEGAQDDGSVWLNENKGTRYVVRGGSWDYPPRFCRSAYRYRSAPDGGINSVGFRLVCVMSRILQKTQRAKRIKEKIAL
jgi:formylglycine-generating enzyme required for sulfatase activity